MHDVAECCVHVHVRVRVLTVVCVCVVCTGSCHQVGCHAFPQLQGWSCHGQGKEHGETSCASLQHVAVSMSHVRD